MHYVYKHLARARVENRIPFTSEFHSHLAWWSRVLQNNGIPIGLSSDKVFQLMIYNDRDHWQMESEMASHKGGYVWQDDFSRAFERRQSEIFIYPPIEDFRDIAVLDLLLLRIFVVIHVHRLKGVTLMVYCHRSSLYSALTRLRCNSDNAMTILRQIHVWCEMNNITLHPFFDPL